MWRIVKKLNPWTKILGKNVLKTELWFIQDLDFTNYTYCILA